MHRLIPATAACLLMCTASVAQQTQSGPPPDMPSSPEPQTAAPPTGALQSSVSVVLLLQDRSKVFPDIATSTGPFTSFDKFKLAANNSVAFFTISAAVIGAGFGQAINSPSGYGQEWGG